MRSSQRIWRLFQRGVTAFPLSINGRSMMVSRVLSGNFYSTATSLLAIACVLISLRTRPPKDAQ